MRSLSRIDLVLIGRPHSTDYTALFNSTRTEENMFLQNRINYKSELFGTNASLHNY